MMTCMAAIVAALCIPASATAQTRVDLALVLAVDISFSIGPAEQDVQRHGYAEAFRDAEVIAAIIGGHRGAVAVTYLEWAGPDNQKLVVPWRLIDGPESAAALADDLDGGIAGRAGRTSISSALLRSAELLYHSPYAADRMVIDVSGDGTNNAGAPVVPVRSAIVESGITINGLAVMTTGPDKTGVAIDAYYRDCVIGGWGAFALPVYDWRHFGAAIRRKLVLEISGLTPPARLWRVRGTDCLAGERAARQEYIDQLNDMTGGRSDRWLPREEDWPLPE